MPKKAAKKQVKSDHRAQPNLPVQPQAQFYRLKATDCLQQADVAKHPETRETFKRLAVNYEKLAIHAESIERQLERRKKSN